VRRECEQGGLQRGVSSAVLGTMRWEGTRAAAFQITVVPVAQAILGGPRDRWASSTRGLP